MTNALFGVIGVAVLFAGVLLVRRLRRWRPHASSDLTKYDPGPDALDWLQAAGLIGGGLTLLVISVLL